MSKHKSDHQDNKSSGEEDATLSLHRAILAAQEMENSAAQPEKSSTKTSEADQEKLIEEDQKDEERNKR